MYKGLLKENDNFSLENFFEGDTCIEIELDWVELGYKPNVKLLTSICNPIYSDSKE
ncbi:hypothetical protein J4446_03150 [Candidatus Woesearchaeota archaeon]|nr:hypothetical protein [Candidatus Woesearchaeota archaeon]